MMSKFQEYMARRREESGGLAEAAVALGQPVFPCDAHKRPLTQHGFKDAVRDPSAVRSLFGRSDAAMIGMPTGELTGLVIIDVDVKDGGQGRMWLDENRHRMPQTRTIRTGSGGLHIYLRHPGQRVRNSASKIAPNIDVRGDGGYVIVPPSPGYVVADDAPIAEIPDWLLPALIPPEPAPFIQRSASTRRQEGGSHYGLVSLQKACDAIRSAMQGTKHDTLNKEAYSIGGLVSSGDIEEGVAFAELSQALEAIRPACKDFRAAEKTLRNAFRDGMGRPRDVPDRAPPVEVHPAAPFLAKLAAQAAKPQAKPLPVEAGMFDVQGALKLFFDYCEDTAISPQPFLSLAAAICLVGAVAGRRYRTATDLRTNIYAVGVADSGGGKDHARKQMRRVLYEAGLAQYLGGSDIASGTAIRTALARHPSTVFLVDEFGNWLGSILGERAPAHKAQIAAYLKELYSSANTVWVGTEYADQSRQGRPREDIQQPHACLYGTTTPGQLWSAIAGASLHDGLMARMLLFVSPCNYPDEQDPELKDVPSELVEALQAIASGPSQEGNLGALMLASTNPEPRTVPNSSEAKAIWKAFQKEQRERQRAAEGTYVTSIAGRLVENAMKLALVRAVSRSPGAPIIEASDAAWGRLIATHCMQTLLREAGRHVADTDYERKINKAFNIIQEHGPCSMRDMWRRGFRLPEKERAEIMRSLIEGGRIHVLPVPATPNGGQPAVRYAALPEGTPGTEEDDQ